MKRKRAHIYLSITLSMLFLAAGYVWVRSEVWAYDTLWITIDSHHRLIFSSHEGVVACFVRYEPWWNWEGDSENRCGWWAQKTKDEIAWDGPTFGLRNYYGFSAGRASYVSDGPTTETGITAPHWAVAGLFGWFAYVFLLRMWHHRKRRLLGLCAVCGYNMRTCADHCPECGSVPDHKQSL